MPSAPDLGTPTRPGPSQHPTVRPRTALRRRRAAPGPSSRPAPARPSTAGRTEARRPPRADRPAASAPAAEHALERRRSTRRRSITISSAALELRRPVAPRDVRLAPRPTGGSRWCAGSRPAAPSASRRHRAPASCPRRAPRPSAPTVRRSGTVANRARRPPCPRLHPQHQVRRRIDVGAGPAGSTARRPARPPSPSAALHHRQRRGMGVALMVEQHHHREPPRRHDEPLQPEPAQRAAMARRRRAPPPSRGRARIRTAPASRRRSAARADSRR